MFGSLSDKIGRKPIILAGCLLAALLYFPLFHALTAAANPKLASATAGSPASSGPAARAAQQAAAAIIDGIRVEAERN